MLATAFPVVIVVMGPSGAGKTSVGEALAARLGWAFVDADDLHPRANLEKMKLGLPLSDEDRRPWLDLLVARLAQATRQGEPLVMASSALKEAYRARLREGAPFTLVYLEAPPAVLRQRLASRVGHFFAPSLLSSQLDALEPPTDALVVDATQGIDAEVDDIIGRLGR